VGGKETSQLGKRTAHVLLTKTLPDAQAADKGLREKGEGGGARQRDPSLFTGLTGKVKKSAKHQSVFLYQKVTLLSCGL
jgi:hypothetical protein